MAETEAFRLGSSQQIPGQPGKLALRLQTANGHGEPTPRAQQAGQVPEAVGIEPRGRGPTASAIGPGLEMAEPPIEMISGQGHGRALRLHGHRLPRPG